MLRSPPRALRRPPRNSPRLAAGLLLLGLGLAPTVAAEKTRLKAPRGAPSANAREQQKARARAERLGLGTMKAAGKLLQGRVDDAWLRALRPERWLGTLRLPVEKGHVSRGFGSGKGGYHQAVDIAGALGSTIRSAASGIVGYADSGVSGYGNFAIIIHAGGFITTYAHNQRLLVIAGQRVARGQPIAELGSTGRSKGPHLHTELLWHGLNCDPMPLFRPVARQQSGAPASELLSLWKQAHKKPKSIRCAPRKHHPDYVKSPSELDEGDEGGP